MAAVFVACSSDQKRYVPNVGDGTATPTMTTTDVSTLISDSGYTRYHLVAGLWQMFEDAEDPYWRFPEGLELEQFDDNGMNTVATVVCDSAVYFSRRKLWRLDGNVVMVNTDADSFLTQQLFWDQTERKILSDSFIHIVRSDRIIEGYGFESDQSMKYYSVNRPTAILPVDGMRTRKDAAKDTAEDTMPAPAAAGAPVPVRDLRKKSGRPAPSSASAMRRADHVKATVEPTMAPADPADVRPQKLKRNSN
ncbi:MAG: LPS export ABC transporter periplasmic protein LptC [Muribaculaceae bacterium]|nr:LPS export ABC transporter periplasmic protein LptC [Muribaculaceae bacterium]